MRLLLCRLSYTGPLLPDQDSNPDDPLQRRTCSPITPSGTAYLHRDSNPGRPGCKPGALPTELYRRGERRSRTPAAVRRPPGFRGRCAAFPRITLQWPIRRPTRAPQRTRTSDRPLRRRVLYPTELMRRSGGREDRTPQDGSHRHTDQQSAARSNGPAPPRRLVKTGRPDAHAQPNRLHTPVPAHGIEPRTSRSSGRRSPD